MMVKKLPLQPVSFKGELKDFTYISLIEPASSSFIVSFGISLLESLIRLKSSPDLTQQTWSFLFNYISSSKDSAKKYNLQALTEKFENLIHDHQSKERKEAMETLAQFIETDILCIEFGIKFLILTITNNPSIIKGKTRNYESTLSLLSQKLSINVFLALQTHYKTFKSTSTSPLVCLYLLAPSQFAVLYHRASKYLDEKPDPVHIDPLIFPFTSTTIISQNPADSFSSVLDLIQFLSNNLQSLTPMLQTQLKQKIETAGTELPGILSLNNLAGVLQSCNHNSNVLANCGKVHCSECLKNAEKCPCGYLLIGNDKNRPPRSVSSGRNRISFGIRQEFSFSKSKTICWECKKPGDQEDFSLVTCKDHNICSKCRAKRIKKGNFKCFSCLRDYQPAEKSLLEAVLRGIN